MTGLPLAHVGKRYRIEMQPPEGDSFDLTGAEARRALHQDGWTDSFDKLERFVSG